MDTEKAWEEFQANDSSIRKSESVQQDIQQILDTVTQIKTDVDQLKAEGPKATGPVDEEPSLSAPEEQQPSPEMLPAPEPEAEPQAPVGDLMAQPEDGAATPTPEEPMPPMPEMPAAPQMDEEIPPLNLRPEDDQDILLSAARRVTDPSIKQQLLAIVYQAIEDAKGEPMPPIEEMAPMMEEGPAPEEILAAAMDANGDGTISEEEIEPMVRSADTETLKCDANVADDMMSTAKSDDEKEEEKKDDDKEEDEKEESDEKKDDDDKSERPEKEEPGVNDELPEGEEDKDSLEELPEVTEVTVETEMEPEPESEKAEAIESIIDSVLEDAKERIKDQVIEATEGIDAEHGPFMMSTAEMMKSFRSGKKTAVKTEPVRKSIDWPEDVKSLAMEDKCRFFAKSFSQMDEKMQDNVITLMDTALGSETTSSIFKSEGVDLDKFYEPVVKAFEGNLDNMPATSQGANTTKNQTASDATEGVATSSEQKSEAVQECSESIQDSVQPEQETQTLEACKKSADVPKGVGIHIPTVSEMMAFKKSGTSIYTPISREAAEPHGLVAMGPDNEIPSVKEMFAKRFGQ